MIEVLVIAMPCGAAGGISQTIITGFQTMKAAEAAAKDIESKWMRSSYVYVSAIVISKA